MKFLPHVRRKNQCRHQYRSESSPPIVLECQIGIRQKAQHHATLYHNQCRSSEIKIRSISRHRWFLRFHGFDFNAWRQKQAKWSAPSIGWYFPGEHKRMVTQNQAQDQLWDSRLYLTAPQTPCLRSSSHKICSSKELMSIESMICCWTAFRHFLAYGVPCNHL